MVDWAPLWTNLAMLVPVAIIVVLTIVVAWVVGLVVGRLTRRFTPHVAGAARRLAVVVVAVIGGTLALQALGVSPDILLVIVALLGVTVLLALRDPLENYGAKFFSDLYTPFKVGDTVEVHGAAGKVIEINPMTTVLLTDKEQIVSVPNLAMLREVVVNTSPQAWKEVVVPVTLSGSIDLPAFESELLKSLAKLRFRLDQRFPPVLTTKARSATSTELTLTLMIRRPEDRDAISAEANKRLGEVLEHVRSGRR
jgi:small conductance mechanosensitive channel